jgi:hypothetical protein
MLMESGLLASLSCLLHCLVILQNGRYRTRPLNRAGMGRYGLNILAVIVSFRRTSPRCSRQEVGSELS